MYTWHHLTGSVGIPNLEPLNSLKLRSDELMTMDEELKQRPEQVERPRGIPQLVYSTLESEYFSFAVGC